MIRNAFRRAVEAAQSLLEAPDLPEVSAEDEALAARVEAEDTERQRQQERLRMLERINGEYFAVIESIERERDQWKAMLFEQTAEHQNAQALLQRHLSDCSGYLRSAIKQLNYLRDAASLTPIENPAMLEQLPEGVPEAFGAKIKSLIDGALPQTKGIERRAELAEELAKSASSK